MARKVYGDYSKQRELFLLLPGEGQGIVNEKVVNIHALLEGIACHECDTSAGCLFPPCTIDKGVPS